MDLFSNTTLSFIGLSDKQLSTLYIKIFKITPIDTKTACFPECWQLTAAQGHCWPQPPGVR